MGREAGQASLRLTWMPSGRAPPADRSNTCCRSKTSRAGGSVRLQGGEDPAQHQRRRPFSGAARLDAGEQVVAVFGDDQLAVVVEVMLGQLGEAVAVPDLPVGAFGRADEAQAAERAKRGRQLVERRRRVDEQIDATGHGFPPGSSRLDRRR